jgi:DNA topoisomerase-1
MVQMGDVEDEEKPKFASLRGNQSITSITFEEAMDLFKLPRTVGEYEGEEVVASVGRFGPYLRHKGAFYSIKKADGDDPLGIEIDRAIEVIEAKRKADREKMIKVFDEDETMQLLNGRWGPYLKQGKKNFRLPKDIEDPKKLSYQDCLKIIEEAPAKKGRGRGGAKTKRAKSKSTKGKTSKAKKSTKAKSSRSKKTKK